MLGICTPALIYLIFSIIHIILDTVKGFFNRALITMIITFVFTFLLNFLCLSGLGILSWILILIPFIFMSVFVISLLFLFNMDSNGSKLQGPHGTPNGGPNGGPNWDPNRDPRRYPNWDPRRYQYGHPNRRKLKRDLVLYHEHAGSHEDKHNQRDGDRFYKVGLDEYGLNDKFDEEYGLELKSDYNIGIDMNSIRDQKLAQYV
jgi:hypothetical protein